MMGLGHDYISENIQTASERTDMSSVSARMPLLTSSLPERGEEDRVRRWDGADTNRLNNAQYEYETGRSLNQDLAENYDILCRRSEHEATTNPLGFALVNISAQDTVGSGPRVSILPRRPERLNEQQEAAFQDYAQAAEDCLDDFFDAPIANDPQATAVDLLKQSVHQLFTGGSFFWQMVNTNNGLRILPVHFGRVISPLKANIGSDESVLLGVRREKSGTPLSYFVASNDAFGGFSSWSKTEEIPVRDMLHGFRRSEPGLVRGVPWMAPALSTLGHLRHFESLVIEAAKLAAGMSLVIYSDHKDAAFQQCTGAGSQPLKLGSMFRAPAGWNAKTLESNQPGPQYEMFVKSQREKVAMVGGMPLNVLTMNSQGLSYSAARVDLEGFKRTLWANQQVLESPLKSVIDQYLRECELKRLIRPRPGKMRIDVVWESIPGIDPVKEANATSAQLKNGSTTILDVWAGQGMSAASAAEKMKRSIKILEDIKPGLSDAIMGVAVAKADSGQYATLDDVKALIEEAVQELKDLSA